MRLCLSGTDIFGSFDSYVWKSGGVHGCGWEKVVNYMDLCCKSPFGLTSIPSITRLPRSGTHAVISEISTRHRSHVDGQHAGWTWCNYMLLAFVRRDYIVPTSVIYYTRKEVRTAPAASPPNPADAAAPCLAPRKKPKLQTALRSFIPHDQIRGYLKKGVLHSLTKGTSTINQSDNHPCCGLCLGSLKNLLFVHEA